MKLGLKIEITSQGAGSAAKTYNSTPALEKYASASRSFIKEVFPVREDLKSKGLDPSESLDESSRSVVFFRFLGPDGLLICVFQARPENSGRPYDGAAAWIHIPASVMLSGSETEKLIDEVEAALSEERGVNYQSLDILFAKEFKQRNFLPAISCIGSNGATSGIRYFGPGTDFQLNELLGNGIAQPVYGNYKAVFFLRKNDAIAVTAPEITTPLTPTCIMSAPTPTAGYNAFFESGMPFNVDLEYPINAPIKVVWKKLGYQDIVKTANAKAGDSNEIANLFIMSKAEVKVAIKKQIFNVIGSDQLGKYQITIDGNLLDNVLYIQEDKLAKGVNVEVAAEGFKTYSKNHMLAVDTQRVDIFLKKQSYIYKFAIPMYIEGERIDNGLVSIELNQRIDECPIEGYSLVHEHIREGEGNVNRLEINNFKETLKHFFYGFFTCMGIIAAVLLYNVVEDIDNVKFQFGWPPIQFVMHSSTQSSSGQGQQQNPVDKDHDAEQTDSLNNDTQEMAIAYLNSIDVWNSDSIAKYSYLDGLFEALNDYKYDELINTWASQLKDVPNFNKVVQAATLAKNAGWNPRQGKHNPTYNTADDKEISLTNYKNWIAADQTQKQNTSKAQTSISHIKPVPTPKKTPPATPANDKIKKNKGGKI